MTVMCSVFIGNVCGCDNEKWGVSRRPVKGGTNNRTMSHPAAQPGAGGEQKRRRASPPESPRVP